MSRRVAADSPPQNFRGEIMSTIRRILRPAGFLGRAAAVLFGCMLACTAAAPAAFATLEPPPGTGDQPIPAGPPVVHTVTVGGTPGWQIALLAAGAAIIAAAVAVLLDRARNARRRELSTDAH
jgi:hypothetical protein